jgi:hypothetical protein
MGALSNASPTIGMPANKLIARASSHLAWFAGNFSNTDDRKE